MSDKTEETKDKTAEESKPTPKDQIVEAQHTVTIGGKEISYTVTTGTLVLKEESEKTGDKAGESEGEKPKATIFFVAYTRNDVDDKTRRPITVVSPRRAVSVPRRASCSGAIATHRAEHSVTRTATPPSSSLTTHSKPRAE